MSDHAQTLRELAGHAETLAPVLGPKSIMDDLRAACLSGADALVREKARQLTPRGQVAGNPLRLLRAALVGMVGTDDPKELDAMELMIRQSPAPASDKADAIDAIDALRATREAE